MKKQFQESKKEMNENKIIENIKSKVSKYRIDEKWITSGLTKEASETCKEFAEYLNKDGLTSTQLRNFFGMLRRIQLQFDAKKSEVVLIDPKLAYNMGRNRDKKKGPIVFYFVLHEVLKNDKINLKEKNQFDNFVNLIESIVAYHKYSEVTKDLKV